MTSLSPRPWSWIALCIALSSSSAWAVGLPVNLDAPVLSISGPSTKTHTFTLHQLAALPARQITTSTQWHSGPQQWEGVPIKALLAGIDATGNSLHVSALNDYAVDIRIADIRKYDPILAYKVNGHYMPVRDKGPLVVIYPYDSLPTLNVQYYHNQSVWQVNRIRVQ
ncbi:molybdopterin-dependent oxidoreductase [Neisseriaceae bacterium JH1-16]|nr:molybdopterin-dependent oxidoreductase [Neisseriaceae bacterium JH1-16]